MQFKPDLMLQNDGTPVSTPAQWEFRRQEILALLRQEIYGFAPAAPERVIGTVLTRESKCCSGHAVLEEISLSFPTEKGEFSFPLRLFLPKAEKPCPLFLLINFRPDVYDRSYPAEEIIDHGFALGVICYSEITSDDGDFSNGLAGQYTRPQDGTGFGKISLWAFAASRALDYLVTRPEIDREHLSVIGHSRLGKTALWCGAQDTRVRYTFSNDSGCAGAALERIKHGKSETIRDIVQRFPYWFCENYHQYVDHTDAMPFDQHFLAAASAPRFVSIGSASLDAWADPYSEQLCCLAASPAWKIHGLAGYIGPEIPAKVGDSFGQGEIGYHLRDGVHFLGRGDWLDDMAFVQKHW